MKMRIVHTILLFLLFGRCFAQTDTLQFSSLTIENGLPHNLINGFIQDKNGFVWIATQNGICRYDGYNFRTYKTDANDFCGLLSSNIRSFLIDKQGNFWVGTLGGGLHRYDYLKDRFVSYNELFERKGIKNYDDVYALCESQNGSLWIGTYGGGIINFDTRNNNVKQYTHSESDSNSLSNNDIRSLLFDSHGRLWIGTDGGGLNLLGKNAKTFIHFNAGTSENSLRNNIVMSLMEDSDGDIWLGTYGGGVHKINYGVLPIIKRFMSDNTELSCSIIWSINEIQKHQIWFATRGAGIGIYDKTTQQFRTVQHRNGVESSLASDMVLSQFRDRSGVIWVATENAGISQLNLFQNKFRRASPCHQICMVLRKNNIYAFAQDSSKNFWIGAANKGLFRYNPMGTNIHSVPGRTLEGDINLNTVFAIITDAEGTLWFGTDGHGLESYNPHTNQRHRYVHEYNNSESISNDAVHALLLARDGSIWLGTYGGGLCQFNPKTQKFKNFKIDNERMKNVALSVYEDNAGHIWVGTGEKGLARLNENGSFTFYRNNPRNKGSIAGNRVWSIVQTNDTRYLWLGTDGGGLCRMEIAREAFKVWNEKDGLPNDEVMSLLVDKQQNIWIGTLNGLARFSPKTYKIEVFTKNDGLINNQFNQNASYCVSNGKLLFGGVDGVDSFYPDSISYSNFAPPLRITTFKVSNNTVLVDSLVKSKLLLNKAITETNQIKIYPAHTIISFEFAALDYRSPESIKYAYKLEGFDEAWVETSSNRRYITYTQLPAGEYIFKVRATNSDGIWTKNYTSLKITVVPPFWKTLWFIILCTIIVLLLIYAVFRIRVFQLKSAKQRLEQAVATQTEELIKQSGQILLQNEEILDQKDLLESQHTELEEHRRNLEIMVGIRTDELRQALERAHEADKLKTAFLTNMSHEIRTPMNTIIGFADMLSISGLPEEKRHRYVAQIYKNGETLVRIIDDIIDIAKIQTGQIRLSKKTTNIGHLLANAQIYAEDAVTKQNKEIDIQLTADEDFNNTTTFTDEFRVMQVLINLLSNAAKYTDKGVISFGAEIINIDDLPYVRFRVSDTGKGITDEEKNYVFKSFSKINSRERHYSGTGLGLCIAQNVVELLGGTIWFEPNNPKGTHFFFTIPISHKDNEIDIALINWKNKKILIAEDDELSYIVLKEMLNFDGVELLWAENGADAIELFQEHSPDLVLMDLRMPELDGYQALAAIRKINPAVPIIAQSAFALYSEREKIMEAGFDELLSKPISSSILYAVIYQKFKHEILNGTNNDNYHTEMMI